MHRFITPIIIALAATAASAHDFWIEPSTFRPQTGQVFTVGLRVGQNFVGDEVPVSSSLIQSFVIREAAIEHDISGYARLYRPGVAIIGYQSKPFPLELTREKYAEFLTQEGFAEVRAAGPRKEQFSRFAKAVVGSGGDAAVLSKPFGWRFEIVPESNPLDASPLRVRILLDKKPMRAALVTAMNRSEVRVTARTGPDGRATLTLPQGVWQIKCVALTDTESLWASLTFER